MQFICYKNCSTCRKAEKWLKDHDIDFEKREITEDIPSEAELAKWISQSGKKSRSFFNYSGNKYRELGLKDKLDDMDLEDQIALLATDGMLIKRPLLISKDKVLVGFREKEYEELLG